MKRMIRKNITLTMELWQRLRTYCQLNGATASAVVRLALEAWLAERGA
jgi:predicted DNA-binding protein